MDLSIIVLTWNTRSYIDRCISSVVESLAGSSVKYEILVVDNGSTDGTVGVLADMAEKLPEVLFVQYLPANLGTTRPRNMALKKARGRYLCIMDCDVEVSAGVFTTLMAQLATSPSVGLVAPKIEYPGGMLQKSWDRFPTLLHKLHRFFRLREMERQLNAQREWPAAAVRVDYAISAFWLLPRTVMEKVGLLDEKIFYSPEDVDYCLRVWKAGYTIVYVPTSSIVHHTQEISRGLRLNSAKFSHLKGLLYLFLKHRYFFRAPAFEGSR